MSHPLDAPKVPDLHLHKYTKVRTNNGKVVAWQRLLSPTQKYSNLETKYYADYILEYNAATNKFAILKERYYVPGLLEKLVADSFDIEVTEDGRPVREQDTVFLKLKFS